jgi:hypothetical protein
MKMKIESVAHWFSITSMAGAVGMVCAGQTVLQPVLHTGGEWVSLLYWSVCAASVISTATFAYLALAGAQQRLRTVTNGSTLAAAPATPLRFRSSEQQLAEV